MRPQSTNTMSEEQAEYHFLPRQSEPERTYNPTQVMIDTFLDFSKSDSENVWCASVNRFFSVSFDSHKYNIYNGKESVESGAFAPGMDFAAKKKVVQEAFTRFYRVDV